MQLKRLATLALAAAVLSGCATQPMAATHKARPAIAVEMGGKVNLRTAQIQLQNDGKARHVAATAEFPYTLTNVAQVPPVTVGGETVQASDIVISDDGNTAVIAHNLAGDKWAGGIQVLDIHDPTAPRVIQQIKFPSMDVNALALQGTTLYFAGAADPDRWYFKSYVGKFDITNPTSGQIGDSLRGLRSHAATSLSLSKGSLYVGVGARDGGVEKLDASTMAGTGFTALDDVRGLAVGAAGTFALAGTTDGTATEGRLKLLGAGDAGINLGDFASAYAKATIEVNADGLAALALSKKGLELRDSGTGALKFALDNPSDSEKEATNGATMDNDLVFTANGGYGFRVLQVLDRTATGDAFAHVVGRHELAGAAYQGQTYSANMVRYRAGHLFVATGVGGVNVYRCTR
ncbi:MAG: hypothetical protein JWM80_1610 [Cyanobacteria bacterium RYN_339]|nr:hypothetical protein [Cyanobacteria bacterium RYN_339]